MTSLTIFDTSVLIAAFWKADAHHHQGHSLLSTAAVKGTARVHPVSLAELAVGAARLGNVRAFQRTLQTLGLHAIGRDEDEPWRVGELRSRTGLGLPDCFVLDAALHNDASLATFDTRLAREAALAGVPTIP